MYLACNVPLLHFQGACKPLTHSPAMVVCFFFLWNTSLLVFDIYNHLKMTISVFLLPFIPCFTGKHVPFDKKKKKKKELRLKRKRGKGWRRERRQRGKKREKRGKGKRKEKK